MLACAATVQAEAQDSPMVVPSPVPQRRRLLYHEHAADDAHHSSCESEAVIVIE